MQVIGMNVAFVSLVVSMVALGVSAFVAWYTLLRRGAVKMTRPTTVYFGTDNAKRDGGRNRKVYLRTLLYSTAQRGSIVESLYLRLRCGDKTQAFTVWIYGEDALKRGSGLFVPRDGVTTNHHFILPFNAPRFEFASGAYTIEVFASLVGESAPKTLWRIELPINPTQAAAIVDPTLGLFFDWSPDEGDYKSVLRNVSSREIVPVLGE